MKHLTILFYLFALTLAGSAQDSLSPARPLAVGSWPLSVSTVFTTSLVFPYGIVNVDIGSSDILIKRSGPAENVLLLKAAKAGFPPTSLSVYTKEGKLYSYRLSYADTLSTYTYTYAGQEDWREAKAFLHKKASAEGMQVRLRGIYSKEGKLWLVFHLRNHSTIDYFTGSVRFRVRDRKRTRKSVRQEEGWEPLYGATPSMIAAGRGDRTAYGFTATSFSRKKEILVEWADERRERKVTMKIPAKLLLRARCLNLD